MHISLGTCADLTPLAASCLEQMGLYPIIISVIEHIYPGVFLCEEIPRNFPSIISSPAEINQLVNSGELLLFDSSTYVNQPQPPFQKAINVAHRHLQNFEYAINIFQTRRVGFTPLPIRMTVVPDSTTEVISIAQKILLEAAQNATLINDSPNTKTPAQPLEGIVAGRIKRWQEKLLDLSNRNRLLHLSNFDFSTTCINFFSQFTTEFLHELAAAYHEEYPDTSLGHLD